MCEDKSVETITLELPPNVKMFVDLIEESISNMKKGVMKEIRQETSMMQKGLANTNTNNSSSNNSSSHVKDIEISKMKQEISNIINSMNFIQSRNTNLEAKILEMGQRI